MDTPLEKIKKLTEMTRRDFLRGTSATAAPKIPGQGLQSLVKGLSQDVDLAKLYKLDAKLKRLIIEYLGNDMPKSLGHYPNMGAFEGIQHTLNSFEEYNAGQKYLNLLRKQHTELQEQLTSTDTWLDSPAPPPDFSKERQYYGMRSFDKWSNDIHPPILSDPKTDSLYKSWGQAKQDYMDDVLMPKEKATGRTLIVREGGPGWRVPIGSPLPEALPSKPAPKKLEGPKTERTTRPEEPEKTTKPVEPKKPSSFVYVIVNQSSG